ncbi:MAG: S1 RNA-binding domain-containing protein [Phormidium sp. GEM2.Bin31]|nr:S1 RNA-binding domain-containing protein [Phormidium sp. BM_Day4_Bin.17]TVR13292.1 MAG: S1 RNA-binding domain-containing protein [Phormidium sp. GEM2.Bin31]UCJ11978.1 MAG: S1 RNA-binding domain-containing protein [Phormidium sp. PBR-2020]
MTAQSRSNRDMPFSMEDFAKALEGHDTIPETGQLVTGKVFEHDANGVYVDIGGKSHGFLPLKEVSAELVTNLEEALPLNEEREFLVIRGANADGQVTLSIRQIEIKETWDKMAEFQESGETVEVEVTGTNRGGVVVDLRGLRGFIPRSHLVERHNLDALIGQHLTVTLLEVNADEDKLVCSHRQAAKASRMRYLVAGELVEGTVANIKPYGVFVELGGVTGLLHIKQISKARIPDLETLFEEGQPLKVIITEIDEWKNRISLSMKELESYPGEVLEKFQEVMDNAEERFSHHQAEDESPQTNQEGE